MDLAAGSNWSPRAGVGQWLSDSHHGQSSLNAECHPTWELWPQGPMASVLNDTYPTPRLPRP